MASMKAVKVAGAAAQAKEPAPKLSETATKPSAAKSGVKKAEQKPREPKKVGKPASASLLLPLPVLFLFVTTYVLRVKPGEEQQAGGGQKVTMEARNGACARGPPSCYDINYYKPSLCLLVSNDVINLCP